MEEENSNFWAVWNRFWHYFNFSWPFPSWVPQLCSLINIIQLFSILFGWLAILNRGHNNFIQSLRYISEFIIFLNFEKTSTTIIIFFVISIIILILLIAGFKFKILILNSTYVILLHFFLDVILPIFTFMLFSVFSNGIEEYLRSELKFRYIAMHSFSTVIFLFSFTVKTLSQSRMMILTNSFTQSWNLWINFFKIIYASVIPLVKVIKNDAVMHDIYYGLCFLYSIIFMKIDLKQVYVYSLMNIFFIAINLSLLFISVMSVFFYHFATYNEMIHLFFSSLVCFASFFISISFYNKKSEKYHEMLAESVDIQTFPDKLINDEASVIILRQLSIYDPQRAILFSEFLFNSTSDPFIYTEAMRFLVVLQCKGEEICDKIIKTNRHEFPVLYRQLIYDAQSYVVAIDVSLTSVESFLSELRSIYLKIELILLSMSEEIRRNNRKKAAQLLSIYSKWCNDFEVCALNAFRHSPNSPQLAELLKQYYQNLRGDFVQSQLWSHRESPTDSQTTISIHSSSSYRFPFSIYGSRFLNSNQFLKSKDPTLHNKLKSQEAFEKVRSKAVISTMIVFCVFTLLTLFIMLYKCQLLNFHLCFSRESAVVFQALSSSLISPILNSAKFALSIIKNGPTRYSNLEIPSSSSISYAVQNLTSFISSDSIIKDSSNEIYNIWSIPQETAFSMNVSVQYLMLQINGLTDQIPHNLTTKEMSFFLMNFFQIYFSAYQPLAKLRSAIYSYIKNISNSQFKFSLMFSIVCIILYFGIIFLFFFFMIHSTTVEKENFWRIIREVDDKSMSAFQESLKDDYLKKSNPNYKKNEEEEDNGSEKYEFPSIDSIIDPHEFAEADRKHSNFKLIIFGIIYWIFVIASFVCYLYYSIYFVNYSIRYNNSLDNLNIALINISNSATECAIILTCDRNESYIFKNLLMGNSNHLHLNQIELLDGSIEKTVIEINSIYEHFFTNLSKWTSNNYQFDSYFMSILDWGLNKSNPIFFNIEEIRFNKFHYLKQMKNSIWLLFSLSIFVLYLIFTIFFLNKVVQYLIEFTFLKSILLLLPSPHLSSVSNLISLFYPENNNEDISVDSIKLQSRYILKQSLDSIVVIDSNQRIQNLNEATEVLTGLKKDELIGCEITKIIMKDDSNNSEENNINNTDSDGFFQKLINFNEANGVQFNLHLIKSDGNLIPVNCTLIKIEDHLKSTSDMSNSTSAANSTANGNSNSLTKSPSGERNFDFKLSSSISYSSLTSTDNSAAFALVLSDRTAFVAQEEKLNQNRKKSESLLYQVLPRVVAAKLLSNNQKLHSKIEKATIMFIGIVNILPWSRKHNPKEIMDQLDDICSMFDNNMARFPTLVKLKFINGTYMAGAGLFNETSPKPAPLEAVEFALLCAQSIANKNSAVNKSMISNTSNRISPFSSSFGSVQIPSSSVSTSNSGISLQSSIPSVSLNTTNVINKSSSCSSQTEDSFPSLRPFPQPPASGGIFRPKPPLPPIPTGQKPPSATPSNIKLIIGINTGPIVAGILGTDKPMFDVWGDAVNVSSRLETSCPCNHIQMSKETMECLPKKMFKIKMRRGVYLKGKGYTNTYTISFEDIMKGIKVITINEGDDDDNDD